MTPGRRWAALALAWGGVALAGLGTAGAGTPDAGPQTRPRSLDAGATSSRADGGRPPAVLSAEDREVVENLELLEHLPDADLLDVLLLDTD